MGVSKLIVELIRFVCLFTMVLSSSLSDLSLLGIIFIGLAREKLKDESLNNPKLSKL